MILGARALAGGERVEMRIEVMGDDVRKWRRREQQADGTQH